MNRSGPDFESELRISPRPVIAALIATAVAITLINDRGAKPPYWPEWVRVVVLLYVISLIVWLLDRWQPWLARWLTVVALLILVHLGSRWTDMQGFLNLIAIPVALSAPLIGFPATVVIAVSETMLLVLSPKYVAASTDPATIVISLTLIWGVLGALYAIYHPRRQLDDWLRGHFQHTQRTLEGMWKQKAELKQALDDLAHANRQQSLTNERLAALRLIAEEAQKTKAVFVAKVSHEFRTPLNMILGLVSLMVENPEVYDDELSPEVLEDLKIVHRNCEHLSGMINDVLALSQVEAGRMTLHRERVDLREVIKEAVAVVRPLLDKKELGLQTIIPDNLQVYCDRTRIRQVILNLVSNAVRYTEEGGLTIRVVEQDPYVVVSVTDTGLGIPPEDAESIFEPFCQGTNKLWRDKRGSGLGLSISKQFVELHGGRIWFESEPGAGTTFSFDLPISPPIAEVANPARWIKEDWDWVERTSRFSLPDSHYQPRVVICDETGELYPVVTRYSDKVEWVDTQSLPQTIRELQQCPAHAVILNAAPVESLWSLVEKARQEFRETPIIGCSVSTQLKYASETQARDYLIKPVTRADLEEAIQRIGRPVRRVLVVDDDPDVLQLFTRMLGACDERLEVLTALSGKRGLDLLRSQSPDLLLLDVLMPDLDGWQVLAIKGQDEAIRDVPVILVSAQDPTEQPMVSKVLLATMGNGLPFNKLLHCSLEISALMLKPD